MNRARARPTLLLMLMGLMSLSLAATNVRAATSSNLSIISSANVLVASRNGTILLEILNVGKYLRQLDVALTVTPPLVLFGDNHWIRSSFAHGDRIRANL